MQEIEIVPSMAKDVMDGFMKRHVREINDFSHVPLEETGLTSGLNDLSLKLTHFDDLYDTLMYSCLIRKALSTNPNIKRIIDFGAGSSIPTLLALKDTSHPARVLAVDIDPAALDVSRKNAETLGLSDRYSFHQGSMQSYLHVEPLGGKDTLIVSNPPYIPTPPGETDYHLLPINGGEYGGRYILEFLMKDFAPETTLVLLWGSLCDPLKVIPAIEEKFEVLHAEAMRIHFGHYTNITHVKKHLYDLRNAGAVFFENTPYGEVQQVVGTILRPLK